MTTKAEALRGIARATSIEDAVADELAANRDHCTAQAALVREAVARAVAEVATLETVARQWDAEAAAWDDAWERYSLALVDAGRGAGYSPEAPTSL